MKKAYSMVALLAAAVVAASQTAIAAQSWQNGVSQGPPDTTGRLELGIDVSNAGNGPEGAKEFLHRLSPERQRGLVNGCRAMLNNPYFAPQNLIMFCQNLVSVTQNFPKVPPPISRKGG
ncbi:MAG TPA: hypothetical protein VII91_09775 [Bauldia sp.]|jgi:hypothetical protein